VDDDMYKKVIFMALMMLSIMPSLSCAMKEDENNFENKGNFINISLQQSLFKKLPNVLIRFISEHLYDKDFHNFASTCKKIRETIIQPKDNEAIIQIIKNENFEKIGYLTLILSKIPKKTIIPQLKEISTLYKNHYPELKKENIKLLPVLDSNFEMFIKIKNITWSLSDVNKIELKEIYEKKSQMYSWARDLAEENYLDGIQFCHFYLKQMSFLSKVDIVEYVQKLTKGHWLGFPPISQKEALKINKERSNLKMLDS